MNSVHERLREVEVELSKAQLELSQLTEQQIDDNDDEFILESSVLMERVNELTVEFQNLLTKL